MKDAIDLLCNVVLALAVAYGTALLLFNLGVCR
jgi:hypothetical protein